MQMLNANTGYKRSQPRISAISPRKARTADIKNANAPVKVKAQMQYSIGSPPILGKRL